MSSMSDLDESGGGVAARMLHAFAALSPDVACCICGRGLRDRVHLESLDRDSRGLPVTSSDLVVAVSRAQPYREGAQLSIPTTTLVVGGLGGVPFGGSPEDVQRERTRAEARAVLLVLRRSLPGATIDQIEVALLAERASRLVVRYDDLPHVAACRSLAYFALPAAGRLRRLPAGVSEEVRAAGGEGSRVTWRALAERLDQLRRVCEEAGVDSVMDEEVVLRVADVDGELHVGSLRSVDVDAGCSGDPCLVLDGDASSGDLDLPLSGAGGATLVAGVGAGDG